MGPKQIKALNSKVAKQEKVVAKAAKAATKAIDAQNKAETKLGALKGKLVSAAA